MEGRALTHTTTFPKPVADGLFESDAEGRLTLIGSRCDRCGVVQFPAQKSCPACVSEDVRRHALQRTGTLWTWTTQEFRPKSPPYTGPDEFIPYTVGYVDLGGEVRVEGILASVDPDAVHIGMEMSVTPIVVADASGERRTTFGFRADRGITG